MGASVSRDANRTAQHTIEESVDYGTTLPNGIYSATQQDYNLRIVRNLIVERKLAPFYKGLSDLPEQTSEPISIPSPPLPPRLPQKHVRDRLVRVTTIPYKNKISRELYIRML